MKKTVLALLIFFLLTPVLRASEVSALKDLQTDPQSAHLGSVLEKASRSYEAVRDYKAVFRKQERSGATLGPQETIFLKFEKPFKIFMGWTNTYKQGLQVLYERGKRGGKLAIHKPGLLLGLAPVIYLDPDSPWVREGSESYDIEDAGIGSFLEDLSKAVVKGAKENKLKVAPPQGTSGGETVEVTFDGSAENEGFFAYRVRVHFDEKTALPDRMELFDWKNEPMGVYAYEDLRLNVGQEDEEFKKLAIRKIYQLYWPPLKSAQRANDFSGKNPRATPMAD